MTGNPSNFTYFDPKIPNFQSKFSHANFTSKSLLFYQKIPVPLANRRRKSLIGIGISSAHLLSIHQQQLRQLSDGFIRTDWNFLSSSFVYLFFASRLVCLSHSTAASSATKSVQSTRTARIPSTRRHCLLLFSCQQDFFELSERSFHVCITT